MQNNWEKAEDALKKGGVAVIPTDTLYGLVGSAFNNKTVERVYKIRMRDTEKPCIILISSFEDLKKFGVKIHNQKEFLQNAWPGKVSVILPCQNIKFKYLHRGTKTLAFRMIGPKNKNLLKILKAVGPIVAPSANMQGAKPAKSINEAKKYFGEKIDVYVNGGIRNSKPSTLISLLGEKPKILRK